MKDAHNVILIIVSSKWSNFFFLELFIISHSRSEMLHLFFSGVPSFPHYHHGDPSKSSQGFNLILFILHFSCSFFSYRSSSWRLYMMVHKGFNSFSMCSSRFFSKKLKFSSSCYPECISIYRIIGGGIMSFLIIWVHVFMIHMLSRLGYFKSINLVIGVIWVIFH